MSTQRVPSFAEATAVVPLSSHKYSANFLDAWAIGSVPHGGTVAATIARVARMHFSTTLSKQDQPNLMTSHFSFVNRTSTGPALFDVEDVKLGRQTSIIQITLSQGDRKEVIAYMTHTNFANEQGPSYGTSWELNPPLLPVDLHQLRQNKDTNWGLLTIRPFEKFRKATQRVDMAVPRAGFQQPSCIEQWIRFSTFGENGRRDHFTDVSLAFVTDTFPQVIEAQKWPEQYLPPGKTELDDPSKKNKDKAYWYPTVLMNLEVKKALPTEGIEWIYQRSTVKMIQRGRYDIETIVMDEAGEVLVISNHVCLIVPATRNTAARKQKRRIFRAVVKGHLCVGPISPTWVRARGAVAARNAAQRHWSSFPSNEDVWLGAAVAAMMTSKRAVAALATGIAKYRLRQSDTVNVLGTG